MTITLGPYVTGERPDPLLHTFEDAEGAAIDLTGYTATATMLPPGASEGIELECTIVDPESGGVVRVDWPEDGIETSRTHRLEVWVDEPDGRKYASQRFRFYVRPALPLPVEV